MNGCESKILQKVTLKTIKNSECGKKLGIHIDDGILCTSPKKNKGVCFVSFFLVVKSFYLFLVVKFYQHICRCVVI